MRGDLGAADKLEQLSATRCLRIARAASWAGTQHTSPPPVASAACRGAKSGHDTELVGASSVSSRFSS
jgi:hypothetical protein